MSHRVHQTVFHGFFVDRRLKLINLYRDTLSNVCIADITVDEYTCPIIFMSEFYEVLAYDYIICFVYITIAIRPSLGSSKMKVGDEEKEENLTNEVDEILEAVFSDRADTLWRKVFSVPNPSIEEEIILVYGVENELGKMRSFLNLKHLPNYMFLSQIVYGENMPLKSLYEK